MSEHTAKAFDTDLQALARMISEMGGLAERQVARAVEALGKTRHRACPGGNRRRRRNRHLSARDRGKSDPDDRPPSADGRRSARSRRRRLRIANDLERIGDLAKNIAKRVSALDRDFQPQQVMRGVEHMTDLVLVQLKNVLDSYARRDVGSCNRGVARRQADRCRQQFAVPRIADLHDGRSRARSAFASTSYSAPRTSSAWAITPPTSPKPSIT